MNHLCSASFLSRGGGGLRIPSKIEKERRVKEGWEGSVYLRARSPSRLGGRGGAVTDAALIVLELLRPLLAVPAVAAVVDLSSSPAESGSLPIPESLAD